MVERNFDEEFSDQNSGGHVFTLGGYTFHVPQVIAPGAFLAGGRGLQSAVNFLRRAVAPDERANLERILEMPDTSAALVDLAPDLLSAASRVLAADEFDTGREEAMKALREVVDRVSEGEKEPGPQVSAVQIDEVAQWLTEVTIGRPTSSSSPSSSGAGRTSNGSKGTSSRRAKAGAT